MSRLSRLERQVLHLCGGGEGVHLRSRVFLSSGSRGKKLKVVIVGGVAGGASAAARARRLSEDAEITIVERGSYVSFANCGLPYHIGQEIKDRDRLVLQTPASLSKLLNIQVLTDHEAVAINRVEKHLLVRPRKSADDSAPPMVVSFDKLILSPGASPIVPPLPGLEKGKKDARVHVLRTLEDMDAIIAQIKNARHVAVLGAGFIGLEVAEALLHLGKQVSLIELREHVLPQMDGEMVVPLQNELQSHGCQLRLGQSLKAIDSQSSSRLDLHISDGSSLSVDALILSVGVKPESFLAKNAGLELGIRDSIRVNEFQVTSDPNIYAVGDVVETADRVLGGRVNVPLGGPANRQGRVAADHIFTPELAKPYPGTVGTAIVRVFDSVGGVVGWTEENLKRLHPNVPFKTVTITGNNHASYFPGAVPMLIKLVWNSETTRILGAQVVGSDGVDKRVDVLATAIMAGMNVDDLCHLELAYAPPFTSARDPVNVAAFAAQNIQNQLLKPTYAIPSASSDSPLILDVRAKDLPRDATFSGKVIPLDELRDRLDELDVKKPIVTVCALGKSSYFASRILNMNGYDAKSLIGGMHMAHSAVSPQNVSVTPASSAAAIVTGPPAPSSLPKEEILVDACGLACPGPIVKLKAHIESLKPSQALLVRATDAGFEKDVGAFCRLHNLNLSSLKKEKGIFTARIEKDAAPASASPSAVSASCPSSAAPVSNKDAALIVFSNDMDKVLAALVLANGAAAMGGKVTMFFTFWGLSALRKEQQVDVGPRDLMSKMMSWYLPRGLGQLPLSQMNFGGVGQKMLTMRMKDKNLPNLHGLLEDARKQKVRLVACAMSMEAMGIQRAELLDDCEIGGVADFMEVASKSGTTLFI